MAADSVRVAVPQFWRQLHGPFPYVLLPRRHAVSEALGGPKLFFSGAMLTRFQIPQVEGLASTLLAVRRPALPCMKGQALDTI